MVTDGDDVFKYEVDSCMQYNIYCYNCVCLPIVCMVVGKLALLLLLHVGGMHKV